jgi:hypothetical protein
LAANNPGKVAKAVDAENKGAFSGFGRVTAKPCDGERRSDVTAEKKDAETSVLNLACVACYGDDKTDKGYGDTDNNVVASFLAKRAGKRMSSG